MIWSFVYSRKANNIVESKMSVVLIGTMPLENIASVREVGYRVQWGRNNSLD